MRLCRSSFSSAARALGLASIARKSSPATSMFFGESYAAAQRPSALAASTCAIPWGVMRPASIKRATFSTLILLQMLFLPRGVKRCT